MESGGPDRRKRSYPWTKSTAARTGGRQSRRASMDGGPTGAEDCAGSGLVGSEVRIGVQGATTSLAMTRVKHNSWSWVRVVARGNGVRRRRRDVVAGARVGSASGDRGRRRLGGWSQRLELYGCDRTLESHWHFQTFALAAPPPLFNPI